MAFSKGNASKEAQEFKRFIGVCPVTVVGVNPNKKEHEKLFGTALEEEPVYVQDKEDNEGKSYKSIRISIILKPDTDEVGFDMPLITMPLFVTTQYKYGANSGKYQVIDKYGRTAWATKEDIQNKQIPVYSTGRKADIDTDYRVAFVGEKELTDFIKTFLFFPNVSVWDAQQRQFVKNPNAKLEECECRLELADFEKLTKGDFSIIKEILGYQPNNKIKVCLGVRSDMNTGRQYQTVYTKRFMSINTKVFNALKKELNADTMYAQQNGRTLNTEYSAERVHEYSVEPTTFTPNPDAIVEKAVEENPFAFDNEDGLPF